MYYDLFFFSERTNHESLTLWAFLKMHQVYLVDLYLCEVGVYAGRGAGDVAGVEPGQQVGGQLAAPQPGQTVLREILPVVVLVLNKPKIKIY